MDLLNIIIKKTAGKRDITKWKGIYRCGIVPILCMLAVLGYGYWNMTHIVETDYTIYTDKNIREEGYRIALLSDLHFGNTMGEEELRQCGNRITETQPDMIILAGDIVDENTTMEQLNGAMKILGSIPSKYGSFYVYGNHDRARYSSSPKFTEQQLQAAMQHSGIHVLSDESYALNEEFTIIGREDRSFFGETGRKSSEELLDGVDTEDFLLLLDHQPRELEQNREAGYDLQLSGHTHGGQIWPVGLISDVLGFGEINYGHRKMENFQAIVSSGMAGWGYPIRTGCHSEYVIVDVTRAY